MRVLGVDPGLTRCGLGVVEGRRGGSLRMVAVDVARTSADTLPEQRLLSVSRRIEEWIERYEAKAQGYAACRFLTELGDGPTDPRCAEIRDTHDAMCRAHTDLPLA